VVCGVPVQPALSAAGPNDAVLVLDCALAPVTGREGECAALPVARAAQQEACGLPWANREHAYQAPVESHRGALQVVLAAFTVARAAANRATTVDSLKDPRVSVLPHVADAWAAGLLPTLPTGPRDTTAADALLAAGRTATRTWLRTRDERLSTASLLGASDDHARERGTDLA
jgi:hypothetical protein